MNTENINKNVEEHQNDHSIDYIDKDLDSTLEDIKEKKQKEREDKLADMMGHYHKKYSNPITALDDTSNDTNLPPSSIGSGSSHKRSLSQNKKKEELAEQMKKYNDQFGNIISSVNSILSSPSSTSSSYSSLTNSPTLSSKNTSNNNNNNNNNNNITNSSTPPPELNLLTEKDTTLTTSTTTTTTNTNEQNTKPLQTETQIPTQTSITPNSQQQPQQPNFNDILYFEHQSIPYLTNVGFKTLKSIEMDAMKCSESVIALTRSLNYSLQMMTKMSVELFHAYKMSTDSLCQNAVNSMRETEIMITRCIELNEQTKSIQNLHQKIKLIKENINRFEIIIMNLIKQSSLPTTK
ncbi:hypothetical protein DLAC_10015 [Tieghemostelium lacteum]|uniref:BLOC-1-related complex subunit 6 C-terminal helix domain-containing protein n=1 Tax=Tieghemostelium lacteum TaxID=361077 RepID=A0A151Z5W9_TIELA|nr:hypothetical protein DLAC_10015 [Tieghemostelium lacteum]|eukprot:KYQ89352.1 hypothetical protein DLAC_10015 [Tieghemostelium lacteum]